VRSYGISTDSAHVIRRRLLFADAAGIVWNGGSIIAQVSKSAAVSTSGIGLGVGRFHKLLVEAPSVNTALMTGCAQPIQLADGPRGSS